MSFAAYRLLKTTQFNRNQNHQESFAHAGTRPAAQRSIIDEFLLEHLEPSKNIGSRHPDRRFEHRRRSRTAGPLPPSADRMPKGEFRRSHQLPDNRKIVLFLGRLHPVKGLPRLLRAWARIQTEKAGSQEEWILVLAGPDEGGHRRELESLVAGLGCQRSAMFVGELNDEQKWAALTAAELFVMPSDFENFGNAIVEAMSCAVPVITTTGTPWKELGATGAGWCIEPGSRRVDRGVARGIGDVR